MIPLRCAHCSAELEGGGGAAAFICRVCGVVFEPERKSLRAVTPFKVAVTTELSIPLEVRYLAVWALAADVAVTEKESRSSSSRTSVWEKIGSVASPSPPRLYVPAFALKRSVVQQLGVALTETQPVLDLEPGLPREGLHGPHRLEVGPDRDLSSSQGEDEPGFGTVSPILLSEADCRTVAHFVYLALENRYTRDLRHIDYNLQLGAGQLLFFPAVFDRRHVRDSNWRFLLREFDGLVA